MEMMDQNNYVSVDSNGMIQIWSLQMIEVSY
jgi:hypothetical protein